MNQVMIIMASPVASHTCTLNRESSSAHLLTTLIHLRYTPRYCELHRFCRTYIVEKFYFSLWYKISDPRYRIRQWYINRRMVEQIEISCILLSNKTNTPNINCINANKNGFSELAFIACESLKKIFY